MKEEQRKREEQGIVKRDGDGKEEKVNVTRNAGKSLIYKVFWKYSKTLFKETMPEHLSSK